MFSGKAQYIPVKVNLMRTIIESSFIKNGEVMIPTAF